MIWTWTEKKLVPAVFHEKIVDVYDTNAKSVERGPEGHSAVWLRNVPSVEGLEFCLFIWVRNANPSEKL